MWDLLVKNIVPILICILSLASGIFIGNKIGRGESSSLYKKDGSDIEFILGPASISNFSLTDLDRSDCAALAERIINLNENNNLAKKLYEASNRHKGIFAIKDFKIAIKFKEADNKVNGDNGAACHNSELYKKHLNISKLLSNSLDPEEINNMKDIFVIHDMKGEECDNENTVNTIWIADETVRKWLPKSTTKLLPNEILARAEILEFM